MWALFSKEISGFFSSLTGYVVIVVFLLAQQRFLCGLSRARFNVIENGYATLDALFAIRTLDLFVPGSGHLPCG